MPVQLSEDWVPTQAEFDSFAAVSGDDNPIHVDPEFAARTAFGRTVSHGMLIYAKLWGMVQRSTPQARHGAQNMMFPSPSYAGETLRLTVTGEVPGHLLLRAVRRDGDVEVFRGELEVTI